MDYLEIRELYHHGIKGQRWGIRRFQNEDGSLTAEGKQRYGVNELTKTNKDGTTVKYQQMSKEGKKLYKKDLKEYKLATNDKNTLLKGAAAGAIGGLAGGLVGAGAGSLAFRGLANKADLFSIFAMAALGDDIKMKIGGAVTGAVLGSIGGVTIAALKNKKKNTDTNEG